MIETPRLRLHHWHDRHRVPFAAMHADPDVMADYRGPVSRSESDTKFERYVAAQREHGISRWAVEDLDGVFLGYCGVMPRPSTEHPLGAHVEVGWRFVRQAWGQGYASESARAAIAHAVREFGLTDILSYTGPDNLRSQAVMAQLGLARDPARDFTIANARGEPWRGLVWVVPENT